MINVTNDILKGKDYPLSSDNESIGNPKTLFDKYLVKRT